MFSGSQCSILTYSFRFFRFQRCILIVFSIFPTPLLWFSSSRTPTVHMLDNHCLSSILLASHSTFYSFIFLMFKCPFTIYYLKSFSFGLICSHILVQFPFLKGIPFPFISTWVLPPPFCVFWFWLRFFHVLCHFLYFISSLILWTCPSDVLLLYVGKLCPLFFLSLCLSLTLCGIWLWCFSVAHFYVKYISYIFRLR